MISMYGGSYVMASAGYNAGPTRPPLWATECGDPRGGSMDPLDYIECIPFTETRNYVMRTIETTEVYRARLNGGSAPLTTAEDLKRGAYGFTAPPTSTNYAGVGGPVTPVAPAGCAAHDHDERHRPACEFGRPRAHRRSPGYTPDPSVYIDPPKWKPVPCTQRARGRKP